LFVFHYILLPAACCLLPFLMPSSLLTPRASRLIHSARIAHLATADAKGRPHVIPICFIFDGKNFYSPIDEKPKRTTPSKLKRLRNIRENPRVALVVDRYSENWSRLAYVLIVGRARILQRGNTHRQAIRLLRRKYRQYRSMAIDDRPMISITPQRVVVWGGS
jgi:coenzyme F420-0:L-glutamate ligase/coenzyme F420-1:gamma-L-glutamate ligase